MILVLMDVRLKKISEGKGNMWKRQKKLKA